MTTMAVQEFLQQHAVRCVLAQFVDIHGTAKAKAVPVEHLGMVLGDGAGFAGFAMWGFGMGPQGPDYRAVGDTASLRILPWMPGYARIVCDGFVKGTPYPYCSRVVLKQQLARLSARGLTLYTGVEPEFMLLTRAADGTLMPNDGSDALQKPCYDYKGLARAHHVLDQIVTSLRSAGIDVHQISHEDANGQFEVNFTYADALRTADDFIFVKMAVSDVARSHGMIGTFMPKPFSDRAGNGTHFHVSLADAETHNLFHDPHDAHGLQLSQLAYHFLGGILDHARALAAICAPTVNSYKRLVVGRTLSGVTWAPAHVAYGDNNRTACVRIAGGRLELRLPDAGCNPYLVSAAIIAAGLDGVDRKLDPGAPNNDNLYEYTTEQLQRARIGLLPQNLLEALEALQGDSVVCAALGESLAQEFIGLKRMEWLEYARHVSDWETRRYLEFF